MRGINRIGNLLVPNLNYVAFEDWFMPVLNRMHDEQASSRSSVFCKSPVTYVVLQEAKPKRKDDDPVVWSPSKIIERMGQEVNDTSSIWFVLYDNLH